MPALPGEVEYDRLGMNARKHIDLNKDSFDSGRRLKRFTDELSEGTVNVESC